MEFGMYVDKKCLESERELYSQKVGSTHSGRPKKDEVTVNLVLDNDQYLLPLPSDLFATLTGGKKLPVSCLHNQLVLDEVLDQMYVAINTTKDLTDCHLVLCQHQPC